MKERLQKILSRAGVTSRRGAEEMILGGRVAINGVVVSELGTKADSDQDSITVDGKAINDNVERIYLVLYKPSGYMTTLSDPQGRPLVTDLLPNVRERVYPVGRLDYNTEGLLLLTNDGEWANALAHPRHEVDKEYHVRVRGRVAPEQIRCLSDGIELEDGKTAPALVQVIRESENNTWLSITIHEGRYRQIRRMCEAVNLAVVRLKRVRYGFLGLEGLRVGHFRFLTSDEVRLLRRTRCGSNSLPPQTDGSVKCKDRSACDKKTTRKGKTGAQGEKRTALPSKRRRGGNRQPSGV